MFGLSRLLDLLVPPRGAETLVRETDIEKLGALTVPTLLEHTNVPTIGLLPYRSPVVRALILEAKFRNNVRAHELLGMLLSEYLYVLIEDEQAFTKQPLALIPIPLSTKRFRGRGYNQVERICSKAEIIKDGTIVLEKNLLARTRDTIPQTTLARNARQRNMEGAFRCRRRADPGITYIIVDDVSTTGATLGAAAASLREAGAGRILTLALAH